ncbi:uncharacterized protein G2W53_032356 [Senna tora]|uniref:Uncharacterized protein n=1 Tax=Senna tora TaxID=362788 RepID=A0A834SYR6_9FABA|nr:uncharacterized protein G2W53_032356 [Senna tora]
MNKTTTITGLTFATFADDLMENR